MSEREIDWLRAELTAIRDKVEGVNSKVDTLLLDKAEREASLRTAGWLMKGIAGLATSGGIAGLVAFWRTFTHGGGQ